MSRFSELYRPNIHICKDSRFHGMSRLKESLNKTVKITVIKKKDIKWVLNMKL